MASKFCSCFGFGPAKTRRKLGVEYYNIPPDHGHSEAIIDALSDFYHGFTMIRCELLAESMRFPKQWVLELFWIIASEPSQSRHS
jgi:hypothetical protein